MGSTEDIFCVLRAIHSESQAVCLRSSHLSTRRDTMYELGKKTQVEGSKVKDLTALNDIWQRPNRMPYVASGEQVVCGYDQGLGERLFVCENLQDMQELYDSYAKGYALTIKWYHGKVHNNVVVFTMGPDAGIAGNVINHYAPNAPKEVKEALAAYAMGNPGAARVLAERAADFTSAKQVEELVGWPLSKHTLDRAGEIWDRLK